MATDHAEPLSEHFWATVNLSADPDIKKVDITDSNNDRSIMTVKDFEHALETHAEHKEIAGQIMDLCEYLAKWCAKNDNGRFHHAHLTRRDSSWLFVIVRNEVRYDNEVGQLLNDLSWDIASQTRFDKLMVEVRELPFVELNSDAELGFIGSDFQGILFRKEKKAS